MRDPRFLYSTGILAVNYTEKIHMPAVSKSAKIPSAWKLDELKAMLATIDRNSPIGKRDYAMILAFRNFHISWINISSSILFFRISTIT